MDYTVFRDRLKLLVQGKGITLAYLSNELQVPHATLSRYQSAQRSPTLTYVVKIAEYFNVSVDWLLGLSDERYKSQKDELPEDSMEFARLYTKASDGDRRVVQAILDKYK